MKLNHLIIIGALCGALLIPSSASSWGVVGLSAGAGCTESETMLYSGSTYTYVSGGYIGQKVSNGSSITICQIDLKLGGTTGTYHVEIWPTIDRTGTQIGGDSSTGDITDVLVVTSVTWSSDYPQPTGDFYIHAVMDTGSVLRLYGSKDNTSYSTTDYDAFQNGADVDKDCYFVVYTQ